MDNIILSRRWVQGTPVTIDNLTGTAFTGEAQAHTFRISGVDAAGADVQITGTVTGAFLAPNNTTIPLTGTLTDGVAEVTLTSQCYELPGRFILSVYAANGDTNLCIYCGVGYVFCTETDQVAYPSAAIPDISQLIQEAQDVIDSIPEDYSALTAEVADIKSVNKIFNRDVVGVPNPIDTATWIDNANLNDSGATKAAQDWKVTEGYIETSADSYKISYNNSETLYIVQVAGYTSNGSFVRMFANADSSSGVRSFTIDTTSVDKIRIATRYGNPILSVYPNDGKIVEKLASVEDDVSDLKSQINFTDSMIGAEEIVFTSGGYIFTYYSAGTTVPLTPTSNANYAYAIMDCVAGDEIHINGEGAGNAYLWSFIDSSDKMIEKSAEGATGTDLVIIVPENSAKVILNSKLSSLGLCFKGSIIKNDVEELQTTVKGIKSQHLLQQSDLALSNSNFVVKDGLAYAVSVTSPYNCMAVNAKEIKFKYRRRTSNNSFYVGVCINGNFVGNRTNAVVTEIKTLYGTTNDVYADAVVNESVADSSYSTDYNDYTATLTGQTFELKKGQTTILKFTVTDGIEIQGIAFLNYYFTYYGTTDNTDFKNGTVVIDEIEEKNALTEQKIANVDIIGNESAHRMVAGVIRNTGNGWEFIVNDRHQGDMNCVSVGIDETDGRLYVDYSGIHAKKVISYICAPDEAFANDGYIMGASVGLTAAYIQIYRYGLSCVSSRVVFSNAGGEVAIAVSDADGVSAAEWDDSTKTLNIKHNFLVNKSGGMVPLVSLIPAVYGKYLMRIYSYGGTNTKIEFINPTTGQKVTTPDTLMSLNFSRIGSALEKIEVDPSTLVSASGNIWFMGIFEV